ncbi:MAG: hypothetical protein IKJ69_00545 [Clostridia bacterium]|nr:hypothetical protein [Clostridia bacterium]
MSEINRDELRELLEGIREKRRQEGLDENGEPAKIWTNEDIDRLLGIAEEKISQAEQTDASIYTSEESFGHYEDDEVEEFKPSPVATAVETVDIAEENVYDADERVKSIFSDEEPPKKGGFDLASSVRSFSGKAAGLAHSFLAKGKSFISSVKASNGSDEERFNLEDDEFDEDEFDIDEETELEEDIKIADFGKKKESVEEENYEQTEDSKTKHIQIEKPGMMYRKGTNSLDLELEGAPTIISVEDVDNEEADGDEFNSIFREAEKTGQITMPGFGEEPREDKPERIDESEAEKELFKRRKAKIDGFVLFGDENKNDPYGSDTVKDRLGDLFENNEERPRRREEPEFVGVEYSQIKDARRVRRYLTQQKKKCLHRVIIQAVLLAFAIIVSVVSASVTTVAGDKILTILSNLIIIAASLVTSNQMIANSAERLKKKIFDLNTAISIASVICFLQTFLMFVLYFADRNTVSVFAGAGVSLFLMSELTSYITFCRTADALELCTGANKDKLYSLETVTDDKDVTEFGKNVKAPSPRIRYSSQTRFPSHLIELCTSETHVDKNMRFIFMIIVGMSVINLIVAWAVNRHFAVGFAAFSTTLTLCVPAYATMLIQLPLSWVNKKFNKSGGMISCQEAVNELCRTNAVILDSRDLFDQNLCTMRGFKDFKKVRIDDAMLYAAAMVIRSGGPLTGVFDQMVVNRRDILPAVKTFSYEEKLGVSGWIYNQKVILGNREMMIHHNIDVPDVIDEDKYLEAGYEVMYLAVAHQLAAMIVVEYVPNKKLAPYLKKLRESGVTILVRNCDPNVTERMISHYYEMPLDNIKILSSASGRLFKKYKSRPKVNSRAVAVHDGTTYTFVRSLCSAAMLRHVFKVSNTMMLVGILMSFAVVLVLSILNVIVDLPAIFIILLQLLMAAVFTGIAKLASSSK